MGFFNWFKQGFKNAEKANAAHELDTDSWCVPDAILCAWVMSVKHHYPVRIITQKIKPGIDHVQAEAQINGIWTPLTVAKPTVTIYDRHFDVEPYRYISLRQFINEQIKFTEPKPELETDG